MKILSVGLCLLLTGCSTNPKLVNYHLPDLPRSCTDRSAALSKKDVQGDLHLLEAAEWHINDRVIYAKERAKWLDCQRFLKRTWQNMQTKK